MGVGRLNTNINLKSIVMEMYKISPNFDCSLTIDELKEKSEYVFFSNGHKGKRPHIKLKEKINGIDIIIISNDRYGIIVVAESTFNKCWGDSIIDLSKNVDEFIIKYLNETRATDLLL